jgi:hypothetical protein
VVLCGIYGQTTVSDIVIARYVADAWRGRVYAVRYFLAFITSGIAVRLIAQLYGRGSFDLVLAAIALKGIVMMAGVYVMAAGRQRGGGGAPGGAAGGVGPAETPGKCGGLGRPNGGSTTVTGPVWRPCSNFSCGPGDDNWRGYAMQNRLSPAIQTAIHSAKPT